VLDQADKDIGLLARMQVLHLDQTERAKRLVMRWRYYEQRQHDDAEHEYDGRPRQRGATYFAAKQQALGYNTIGQATATSYGQRRPSLPTTIGGTTVDTYTAMLLGGGRQPAIKVSADRDSTDLLAAMFAAADVWDSLAEARKFAGAEGAAAILPEIIDGTLSVRSLRAEDLYYEWESETAWIPRIVVEQKRVSIDYLDDAGKVCSRIVWRTRAWDQRYAYVYEDVDEDFGKAQAGEGPAQRAAADEKIELAEAQIEHKAGRCPVIWLQNTRCSDDPIGDTDYEGVFERIDKLDHLESMILRGTTSNNDPTLVIKDKLVERRMWAQRAKGHGQKIEVSEVGSVELLEMSGKTIETSWLTARSIKDSIAERTGVIPLKPDEAGAMQSGVALQILRGTLNSRVGMRRPSLGRTIAQLCRVCLTLARQHGIKDVGAGGKGIELPQREIAGEGPGDEPTFELPKAGKGSAVIVTWGELHSPTPSDLQVIAGSLTVATGGQPVLSQETGVAMFGSLAQTETESTTELARIAAEREAKVASFESSMTPGADGELDDLLEDEKPEQTDAGKVKTDDVQATALNGAQVSAFLELMADTGVRIAPGVSKRFQARAFQIPIDEAEENVRDQLLFLAEKPRPEAAPVPNPKALAQAAAPTE
jgi:hypothetical protein